MNIFTITAFSLLLCATDALASGRSVLVIDLNRNGRKDLVSAWDAKPAVLFDLGASGQMERTSWVGKGDALLAIDKNGNGLIDDGTELIGNVSELFSYDANHDGVIDAGDAMFSRFCVWQDMNQNGISEARELTTLLQWDVTALTHSALQAGSTRYKLGSVTLEGQRRVLAASHVSP